MTENKGIDPVSDVAGSGGKWAILAQMGTAATASVGTVSTLAAGSSATVTNSGTTSAAVFNFSIPQGSAGPQGPQGIQGTPGVQGIQGPAATITVNSTTTGSAGSSASVTNSGTSSAAKLDFVIPTGPPVNFRGTWASDKSYVIGDAVAYNAGSGPYSSYIAIANNTGQAPAYLGNNTYWDLLAQAGTTGETGATGAEGPAGATGATGAAGSNATVPANVTALSGALSTAPYTVGNGIAWRGATYFMYDTSMCEIGDIILSVNGYGSGALPADGRLLQISAHSAAYSLLGTNFGGDGVSTFALPDLRPVTPKGLQYSICIEGMFPSAN